MIGQTISHYKILERLGKGGVGEVWKAEDTRLRRTVALKFLSAEAVEEEQTHARLVREAQASASLDHPNIWAVHGIHEGNGETFIAMAYIDGPSLADSAPRGSPSSSTRASNASCGPGLLRFFSCSSASPKRPTLVAARSRRKSSSTAPSLRCIIRKPRRSLSIR